MKLCRAEFRVKGIGFAGLSPKGLGSLKHHPPPRGHATTFSRAVLTNRAQRSIPHSFFCPFLTHQPYFGLQSCQDHL